MKATAVHQAYERLKRAKGAAAPLADPNRPFDRLLIDWSEFITATNTIYTKLEQGSKGNQKSEEWFARQKGKRRKDALLRYLRAARNSDEHSLEIVAGPGLSGTTLHENVTVGVNGPGAFSINLKEGATNPLPGTAIAQIEIGFYPLPVTDTRFNESFSPPESHLGRPIITRTATGLAALALNYLEQMIAEAAALAA